MRKVPSKQAPRSMQNDVRYSFHVFAYRSKIEFK